MSQAHEDFIPLVDLSEAEDPWHEFSLEESLYNATQSYPHGHLLPR